MANVLRYWSKNPIHTWLENSNGFCNESKLQDNSRFKTKSDHGYLIRWVLI